MCGIVGIIPDGAPDPGELRGWIKRMCDAIVHRGPDDEGIFIAPGIALGMRRLAILDVARGRQPMHAASGRYTIVFNGEIYNHLELRSELVASGASFATDCDTETVLRAFEHWGADGLKRLEGMFGVAIWDRDERRLSIARDWLGQKSIYATRCSLGWAFASEIKALLVLPGVRRSLDVASMSHYMSMRYLPGEGTFFQGISKLPAAHLLQIDPQGRSQRRLWTPNYLPKWTGSEAQMLDDYDELMAKVVGQHLMSDVPLGAFLSGGIDSSLVVAYAAKAMKEPLSTFAIGVDVQSQSELPWARQVAERYQTRHIETMAQPDFVKLMPRMVATMEEPVDPFAYGVYMVSEAARAHVTVALGGDGGDELFAGYDRYKGQELAELYSHVPKFLRHGLMRPLIKAMPDSFGYNSTVSRLRWLDELADAKGFERYAQSAAILRFPAARKRALFTESAWRDVGNAVSERLLQQYFEDGSAEAFLDRMLHADCMTRLADHQLPIVDKMSMAHSLEVRSPFLDRRLAEFAARIPSAVKLRKRRIKYFTRKLSERYLPRDLIYRPKQGFSFPIALWLRDRLRPLMYRAIEESRLAEAGIFRREEMRRLADEHVAGRFDHNYRLWMIINLEMFWRHYIESTPTSDLEGWIAECL